jgi:hypothetical protein
LIDAAYRQRDLRRRIDDKRFAVNHDPAQTLNRRSSRRNGER